MASIALRSRLMARLTKLGSRNPRIFSTEASSSNSSARVQGISCGQSMFSDFPPPNLPPPHQAEAAAAEVLGKKRNGLKYLNYGLIWALTGATAATGYASYAYTLDEVNEKTKALRESAKQTPTVNSSGLDKYQNMLYSAAMTGFAKTIDMYLELREVLEEQVKGFTEPLSEKLLPDLQPSEQKWRELPAYENSWEDNQFPQLNLEDKVDLDGEGVDTGPPILYQYSRKRRGGMQAQGA